jgi:hypothetical protein
MEEPEETREDGAAAAAPMSSRRRSVNAEGVERSRSVILLVAALLVELMWLVVLGYVLYRVLK